MVDFLSLSYFSENLEEASIISLNYFILKIHWYHVLTMSLLPHALLFSSLLFINSLSFAQIHKAENSISWNFSQVVIFPVLIQSKGFKGPLHTQYSYTFISVPNSPCLHTDFFIQLPVQHHSLMGNMHVKINISKAKLYFFLLIFSSFVFPVSVNNNSSIFSSQDMREDGLFFLFHYSSHPTFQKARSFLPPI